MADPVTTIGLCAGVAWLDEGVRAGLEYLGLRHRTACFVERDSYAATVLLARMEEASLEPAPVWCGDLADFDGRAFRGAVDGIVAGFPCQPWSNAGQRKGTDDERWLWPAIVRVISDVGPGFVFLENVSALIAGGGLDYVLSDLAEMGFDAEWLCLTAGAVGASHRRERVFLLAYRAGERFRETWRAIGERGSADMPCVCGSELDYAKRPDARDRTVEGTSTRQRGRRSAIAGEPVADTISTDIQQAASSRSGVAGGTAAAGAGDTVAVPRSDGGRIDEPRRGPDRGTAAGGTGEPVGDAKCGRRSEGDSRNEVEATEIFASGCRPQLFAPGPGADWSGVPEWLWPATQPGVRVLVDGSALVLDESRADQLRCSGNGVVALCAATAFVELVRRAGFNHSP